MHLLNSNPITPEIFHQCMHYAVFNSKSHLLAKQHLYHHISNFLLVLFLHLSMCDVLQRQLLSAAIVVLSLCLQGSSTAQ